MLVELGLVEQRLKAVHEVLDGATVTDVAKRNGVTRQTVHTCVRGHEKVPAGGHLRSPLVATKVPTCGHEKSPPLTEPST